MIPPHNSLVRYDNPILVSAGKGGKASKEGKKETPGKASTTPTEDILNSILPPRFVSVGRMPVLLFHCQPNLHASSLLV